MAVKLESLAQLMLEKKASDLHIRSGGPAYVRIDGDLHRVQGSDQTAEEVRELALGTMNPRARKIFDERCESDYSVSIKGVGRFRVNAYLERGVVNLAMRYITSRIPTIDDLGLPADTIKKIASSGGGIILVTGITGSGKSSTLASMVGYINETEPCHIITIEDPIEFIHENRKSIMTQRELGNDTMTFFDGLRSAMRQDPDVILVGEMRDLETTQAAITAAQTGHLVMGTLHTTDAMQTITRIVDIFPTHQQTQVRLQLSDPLKAVISQRLIQKIGGGRVPAVEIMVNTPHIKKCIEDNHLNDIVAAMQKGAFYGMQTFNQSLVKLHKGGLCNLDDVLAAASNPDDVLLAVRGIEQGAEQKF